MNKDLAKVQYKCGHKELVPVTYKYRSELYAVEAAGKRFVCKECRRKEIGA